MHAIRSMGSSSFRRPSDRECRWYSFSTDAADCCRTGLGASFFLDSPTCSGFEEIPSQKTPIFLVPRPRRRVYSKFSCCLWVSRRIYAFLARHNSGVASLASKSRQYRQPTKRAIPRFPKEFIPNYSVSYKSPEHLSEPRQYTRAWSCPTYCSRCNRNETDPPWYDLDMSLYSTMFLGTT